MSISHPPSDFRPAIYCQFNAGARLLNRTGNNAAKLAQTAMHQASSSAFSHNQDPGPDLNCPLLLRCTP
jgi:hypothetical protein